MKTQQVDELLPHFEGLVFETARQIVASGVELDVDDVKQMLRVKVWYAVERYNGGHVKRMPLDRWVFMCVRNLRKDIEDPNRRPRRYNASIDELRERSLGAGPLGPFGEEAGGTKLADWFDLRYLSIDAEQVFGHLFEEELRLPSTLSAVERRVVRLRLRGRLLCEIDRELGLSRAQRERVMRSVRTKLADWAPVREQRSAPMPPLPHAEPRRTRARASLAA